MDEGPLVDGRRRGREEGPTGGQGGQRMIIVE